MKSRLASIGLNYVWGIVCFTIGVVTSGVFITVSIAATVAARGYGIGCAP